MKKIFLIFILCLIFASSVISDAKSWSYPLEVDIVFINFNYNTSSYSDDALSIKKDYSSSIYQFEWQNGGTTNKEIAYIKSQSNRKVQAKFYHNQDPNQSYTMVIEAGVASGTGIGYVDYTTVYFDGGGSSYSRVTTCNVIGTVPSSVGKRSFKWDWSVAAINDEPVIVDIEITGWHYYYTLLAAPQNPMPVPWTDVLDYACDWASGQSSSSEATNQVVQHIYNDLGLAYDTYDGSPTYTTNGGSGSFNLTGFLSDVPGSGLTVNCYDCGKAVKIFANALGCGVSYKYSTPFGYLNCIKPIGRGWTNNPFYDNPNYWSSPIVGEDTRYNPPYEYRSYFGNHAFGIMDSNIYDATLKVDTDSNPDYGPPFTESWATGWSWSTYKSKVVDNNPATSTGDPSTYDFSVY